MGIFGFGALRDRFASVIPHSTVVSIGYVACFDITPLVVYAIRHSTGEDEFVELFRRRMEISKEVRFLRANPPHALHYTLDNRAPLAKRHTQMQRLLDARPIVSRLTVDHSQRYDGAIQPSPTAPPLRIKDLVPRIREILLRDFVLTAAASSRRSSPPLSSSFHRINGFNFRRRGSNGENRRIVENNRDSGIETSGGPYRRRGCSDGGCAGLRSKKSKLEAIDNDKSNDLDVATFAQANRIEFDYDEGEGEIKAINWLAGCDKGRLRLIMARDNDVFVYILSKLQTAAAIAPIEANGGEKKESSLQLSLTTTSSRSSSLSNYSWRSGRCFDGSDDDRRRDVVKEDRESVVAATLDADSLLVYHEGSNDVLLCWKHLSAYHSECWILMLWLSVCFGNDFTFGVLDKSIASISYYYPLLEQHFISVNGTFKNSVTAMLKNRIDDHGSPSEKGSNDGNDEDASSPCDGTTTIINSLTLAFCKLRDVLRHGGARTTDDCIKENYKADVLSFEKDLSVQPTTRSSFARDDDDVAAATVGKVWLADVEEETASAENRDDDKTNVENEIDAAVDNDDDYVHLWIARQLWSFFYTLELPSEFTRNQRFRTCPTLRINESFDKPFMTIETFLSLRDIDFQRHVRSIVRYGI